MAKRIDRGVAVLAAGVLLIAGVSAGILVYYNVQVRDARAAAKTPGREHIRFPQPTTGPRYPDIVYVPTPQVVVDKMLELAEIKKDDVVYDLGCGDGRIVVTAAKKYGVKAVGVDLDPECVRMAKENVKAAGVEKLVRIERADIFQLDFSEATVVMLYLFPDLNVKLMPQLAKLKSGSRILSHDFDMKGAKPLLVHQITTQEKDGPRVRRIYKWVVPWEKEAPPK